LINIVRFNRIFAVNAAGHLPLSQAEGTCFGGKVTSMHSLSQ